MDIKIGLIYYLKASQAYRNKEKRGFILVAICKALHGETKSGGNGGKE